MNIDIHQVSETDGCKNGMERVKDKVMEWGKEY